MAKYICELCKKESDIPVECCGSPMKLVEAAIPEQQETASQEQPAAEAQPSQEEASEEKPAKQQEDTSSA